MKVVINYNEPNKVVLDTRNIVISGGAGGGDMYKTTYDANGDGIVDNAEKVNGKIVEIDVNNQPVSQIMALDDWANA